MPPRTTTRSASGPPGWEAAAIGKGKLSVSVSVSDLDSFSGDREKSNALLDKLLAAAAKR